MENLGYQKQNSTWILRNKPSNDQIIENIFKYCLYSYIVKDKRKEKDEDKICKVCDSLMIDGECTGCQDTAEIISCNVNKIEKAFRDSESNMNSGDDFQKADNIKYTDEMKRDQPSVKTTDYYSLNERKCGDQRADRFGKESKTYNIKYKDEMKKDKTNKGNSDQPSVKTPDYYSLNETTCEDQRADGFGNKSNKTISAKTVIASNTNLSTLANTKSIVCDNKWACSKCSYENETSDVKCVTCSHTDRNGGKETG